MEEKKMLGTVKWFKDYKGYGYIEGGDGESYFFELIDCVNMQETFTSGDEVLFIPNIGDMDFATKVEKINESSVADE